MGTEMGSCLWGKLASTLITVPSGPFINGLVYPGFDRQATVCTTGKPGIKTHGTHGTVLEIRRLRIPGLIIPSSTPSATVASFAYQCPTFREWIPHSLHEASPILTSFYPGPIGWATATRFLFKLTIHARRNRVNTKLERTHTRVNRIVHPEKHGGGAVQDISKENRATEERGFESPNATT
jgi:hypothetical protein